MKNNVIGAARRYVKRGFSVIPVPYKQKGPKGNDWQKSRFQADDLEEHFSGIKNIGVLTGTPSDGLADVDLDCEEARKAAYYFLSETGLVSGRKSNPACHHWYRVTSNLPAKTFQYRDVPTGELNKRAMLVELRWTGMQTIIPPSVHPSGEDLVWEKDGEPAEIDGDDLRQRVRLVAAVALVARHWPDEGMRNECSLALSGTLLRCGFSLHEAAKFIKVAAWIAHDEEYKQRGCTVRSTSERLEKGETTYGFPKLKEFFGEPVVEKLVEWLGLETTYQTDADDKKKRKRSEVVLDIVSEDEVFCDENEEPFARIKNNGHCEILPVKSKKYRNWLSRKFFKLQGEPARSEEINDALRIIEAQAVFEGKRHELFVRVAPEGKNVWLDLCDAAWRAVRITGDGWEIVDTPPIIFRRYPRAVTQVEPLRGGDIGLLRPFLNVESENLWRLLVVFLVASLIPDIPHPVLVGHGQHGSAKSTAMRMLVRLIDPSTTELRASPRDIEQWILAADHSWMVVVDNVSQLPEWLSDAMCRGVTGESFSKRELYTDSDEVTYTFRRIIALTGIPVMPNKPDLLDRSILCGFEPIASRKRRCESDILKAFEDARPAILGGMLDTVSKVLSELPSVNISNPPRMADFAKLGVAVERVMGWENGSFMDAYSQNMSEQNTEAIEASCVGEAICKFMANTGKWVSAPTDLWDRLTTFVEEEGRVPEGWPKSPSAFSARLKEVAPNLNGIGISVRFDRDSGSRFITVENESAAKSDAGDARDGKMDNIEGRRL